jgi:hypothetical protein
VDRALPADQTWRVRRNLSVEELEGVRNLVIARNIEQGEQSLGDTFTIFLTEAIWLVASNHNFCSHCFLSNTPLVVSRIGAGEPDSGVRAGHTPGAEK